MIFYNPTNGVADNTAAVQSKTKHCFLMTQLGGSVPAMVKDIGVAIKDCCKEVDYKVIDARTQVSGRDFLIKIWKMIASSPLSVGVIHENMSLITQANIYYELGVAQAMGKETIIVKSPESKIPSDFIRSEYIEFDEKFAEGFRKFLESLFAQAEYYESMADALEKDPVLVLDYLRRAYLITGNKRLKRKSQSVLQDGGIRDRAANSVENLVGSF